MYTIVYVGVLIIMKLSRRYENRIHFSYFTCFAQRDVAMADLMSSARSAFSNIFAMKVALLINKSNSQKIIKFAKCTGMLTY